MTAPRQATAPGGSDGRDRSWKILKAGLVASLAFNLLVLGAMAGTAWTSFGGHGGRPWRLGGINILEFTRSLPSERRQALGAGLEAQGIALRQLHQEVRQSRRAVGDLLTAEPFDKESMRAFLARVSDIEARYKQASYELLTEIVSRMSAEERRAFLKWRNKRHRHSSQEHEKTQ